MVIFGNLTASNRLMLQLVKFEKSPDAGESLPLDDALEKFVAAMDMHLGSKHDEALFAAEDNARNLLALSKTD